MITEEVHVVGVDVSKATLELGCMSLTLPASIPNTPAGFKTLLWSLARFFEIIGFPGLI